MKKAFVVWFVLSVALTSAVFAQKPAVVTNDDEGWQKIGEISASFRVQNESIAVLGADEFDAIKLKVTDAPINIQRLQVFYESGDMQEIDIQSELQAGAETRVIKLDQDDDIRKVAFTYKTLPNYRGEKAHVELHGYKSKENADSYRKEKNELKKEAEKTDREVREEAKETGNDVEKSAQSAGDKIAETEGNVEGHIRHQEYKTKMGPDGQKIFIDGNDQYYYITDKGLKKYLTKAELRDRPKKD